jgi:hypothetical protein
MADYHSIWQNWQNTMALPKNLMRYLELTIKQNLRFGPGRAQTDITMQYGLPIDMVKVYTVADWASNCRHRKSISGGVALFYGAPIS